MSGARRLCWFVTYFKEGDAISNQAIALHHEALAFGWESVLFIPPGSDEVPGVVTTSMHGYTPQPGDIKVVHYGAYGPMEEWLLSLPGPTYLYYHNVTPAHFFRRVYFPWLEGLERAREVLPLFPLRGIRALADSEYNRRELERAGFRDVHVQPLFIDPAPFERAAREPLSPEFISRFPGASVNWLHVGRIVPNKRIEDIIRAFYIYRAHFNPDSHLFLVGSSSESDIYLKQLVSWVDGIGASDSVTFSGKVSQEDLLSFYRHATLYVSMSEHEGFGVPLVEAMWSRLPIIAYRSSAVTDTMGEGGVLLDRKDPVLVARVADMLVSDHEQRERILVRQLVQASAWHPEQARRAFRTWLTTLPFP